MLQRNTRKITIWVFVIGGNFKEAVGEEQSSKGGGEAYAILRNLTNVAVAREGHPRVAGMVAGRNKVASLS